MILFASLGQAQDQNQNPPNTPTTEQEETHSLPIPLPVDVRSPIKVDIVESDKDAEARKHEEYERTKREKDDLIAQQGMNAATQAMNEATQKLVYYSKFSTIFVGVGTILLFWTLYLTRQANKSAGRAVDVTREIGQAQARAYVAFDGGNIHFGDKGTFHCTINNFGTTPAYDVAISIKCAYSAAKTDLQDIKWGEPKELSECPSYPNQPITYNYSGDGISETGIPKDPDEEIWFYGSIVIKYRDVFKKEFECEYIVTNENFSANILSQLKKQKNKQVTVGSYRTTQIKWPIKG